MIRPPLLALALLLAGCDGGPSLSAVRADMAAEQRAVAEPVEDSAGMVLVPIPAGEFWMGTAEKVPEAAEGKAAAAKKAALSKTAFAKKKGQAQPAGPESPRHRVRITRPFLIGVCEVTQGQFAAVTGRRPWAGRPLVLEDDSHAASYVSWEDAAEFCRLMSDREGAAYRLPTEAEWEYACRAGTDGAFSFADPRETFADHVWFLDNAYRAGEQYPHAAGAKRPNPWALRDTHGNVWEWCADWYGPYPAGGETSVDETSVDPSGPASGPARVWRGGGFFSNWPDTRSAARLSEGRVRDREPAMAGFRVVRELP